MRDESEALLGLYMAGHAPEERHRPGSFDALRDRTDDAPRPDVTEKGTAR